MKDINDKLLQHVRARLPENIKSGNAALDYMNNSTAVYKGEPVACLYLPKIFSAEAWDCLQKASDMICVILDKVIRRYLDCPDYRKLFPFSKELEELILTEAGYPRLLPIARIDLFLNEEDLSFKFCEFNADGASAMNEDRELNIALAESDALTELRKEYDLMSFELFDSWVCEFIDIYQSYSKRMVKPPFSTGKESLPVEKAPSPRIVITDIMENATSNEFLEFQKAFQRAGYDCEICDIRHLEYNNGQLTTPDGKPVHAIYRRAVTRDIMEHIHEVGAFLQAVREEAVCLVGHFRTQIIHNKAIFLILRRPETLDFLTSDEREFVMGTIPETFMLESGNEMLFLNDKDQWIIKPLDLYGSRGVYAGVDMEPDAWREAVMNALDTGYIIQRFCSPYKSLNMDFNKSSNPDFTMYNNLTGLFVYNGKLKGIYSRAGTKGMIATFTGALTMLSLVANKKTTVPH